MMEFLEHLKTYLSDEEIVSLATALKEKGQHALLLNTDKMSQETLLTLFPLLKKSQARQFLHRLNMLLNVPKNPSLIFYANNLIKNIFFHVIFMCEVLTYENGRFNN